MQVAPSGGHASSTKIATNASCITCWPNWEPTLVLSPVVGTAYNHPFQGELPSLVIDDEDTVLGGSRLCVSLVSSLADPVIVKLKSQ